ncbi:type I-F CRISPR-associated protein Csy1 [Pseudoalteromonas sp. MMG005]|uniref:type I-F CRISPR-associated protein Csy1 n=1 Tax=Pseudoalteromonas sp. MMG005 TaxID=2822682 RepID=UPI001B39F390|nr:type I-F CRISPR-associated protein Csy1 [Pseudoalteromonas sp. MMG005]MBQ4845245.1 type I-F CRISPR-associated protein Csy1 [Pseudoalteromonas sp. MMG005]
MNENEQSRPWSALIKEYIDSTGEQNKLAEYRQLLLADFYKSQLLTAKAPVEQDLKAFNKAYKAVEKIKITAKECDKLSLSYTDFISKTWIKGSAEQLAKLQEKSCFYNIWICKVLMQGDGVFPATHIAKLTHSSSCASSIFDRISVRDDSYLTTSSLQSPVIDGAYPNGALSKNVKFLMLDNSGLLSEEIYQGNSEPLSSFADDEQELASWMAGFNAIFNVPLKSDSLAKQVYFPVDDGYHLLTLLTSSATCQAIYDRCFSKDVKKQQEKDGKAVKAQTYSDHTYVRTSNTAKIATVASQPQNVSVLNGKRAGKVHLFSSQPPVWQSQLKAPLTKTSYFDDLYPSRASQVNIEFIRDFIIRFNDLSLSIKDPKRKQWLEKWVQSVFDEILDRVSYLHALPAGWSAKSELTDEYQCFLDPYRQDQAFQAKRKTIDWQTVVRRDFARWLNRWLVGKDKTFTATTAHRKLWQSFVEQKLRKFESQVQVTQAQIAQNMAEEALR